MEYDYLHPGAHHRYEILVHGAPLKLRLLRRTPDTYERTFGVAPANRVRGYCSRAKPLVGLAEAPIFSRELTTRWLDSLPEEDREDAEGALEAWKTEAFETWVRSAWLHARAVAPTLRGFLSVHDTIWLKDLDTGERVRNEATGFRFS